MNSLRQLSELQNRMTELNNKYYELDEFLCQVTDTYDALCEAGADGYKPNSEAEYALAYLSRYTLVPQMLLAKTNAMVKCFINDVIDILIAIDGNR